MTGRSALRTNVATVSASFDCCMLCFVFVFFIQAAFGQICYRLTASLFSFVYIYIYIYLLFNCIFPSLFFFFLSLRLVFIVGTECVSETSTCQGYECPIGYRPKLADMIISCASPTCTTDECCDRFYFIVFYSPTKDCADLVCKQSKRQNKWAAIFRGVGHMRVHGGGLCAPREIPFCFFGGCTRSWAMHFFVRFG